MIGLEKLFNDKIIVLLTTIMSFTFSAIGLTSVFSQGKGNEKQSRISSIIRSSAFVYLKKQYIVVWILGLLFSFGVFFLFGIVGSVSLIIGLALATGNSFIAMNISTATNSRTVDKAKESLYDSFRITFLASTSSAVIVVITSLITIYASFNIANLLFPTKVISCLTCIAIGTSFTSILARLGGGIFTKSADMGADMVGKLEMNLPEDSMYNPATIADNVGDNVGDCAGMTADLVESVVVALCSIMILLNRISSKQYIGPIFILSFLGVFSAIFSYCFVSFLNNKSGPQKSVDLFNIVSFFVTTVFSVIVGRFIGLSTKEVLCFLSGIIVAFLTLKSTEYYTSPSYYPVKKLVRASATGGGTNIVYGISIGYESTFLPVIFVSIGVLLCYTWKGLIGIALGTCGIMAVVTVILSLDFFGPIVDNAGGIAEMTENTLSISNSSIRANTDELDSIGNTTKAITKGYAISSAIFAAMILFFLFSTDLQILFKSYNLILNIDIFSPVFLTSSFLGGILPMIFSAMSLRSVSRGAAAVVNEVRKQVEEFPGILTGQVEPDYESTIKSLTNNSIKEMIIPSLLPVVFPVFTFLIVKYAFSVQIAFSSLSALLIGSVVSGSLNGIAMVVSGGAWDNAKKVLEKRKKGTEDYKAAVIGDTVGDPFKDTAGPSLNSLIKMAMLVGTVIISFYSNLNIPVKI